MSSTETGRPVTSSVHSSLSECEGMFTTRNGPRHVGLSFVRRLSSRRVSDVSLSTRDGTSQRLSIARQPMGIPPSSSTCRVGTTCVHDPGGPKVTGLSQTLPPSAHNSRDAASSCPSSLSSGGTTTSRLTVIGRRRLMSQPSKKVSRSFGASSDPGGPLFASSTSSSSSPPSSAATGFRFGRRFSSRHRYNPQATELVASQNPTVSYPVSQQLTARTCASPQLSSVSQTPTQTFQLQGLSMELAPAVDAYLKEQEEELNVEERSGRLRDQEEEDDDVPNLTADLPTPPQKAPKPVVTSAWASFQNDIHRAFRNIAKYGWVGPSKSSSFSRRNSREKRTLHSRHLYRQVTRDHEKPPLGFSFSPAGLLLPYHLGVAACLKDFGVLHSGTPVSGASAGALAACAIGGNLDMRDVIQVMYRVETDLKENGAAQRLHGVLDRELRVLLPEDIHERLNERKAKVIVSYTHVWPLPKGQFVSRFSSLEDLLEVLSASCNIPFYFTTWPTVTCRGRPSVDGYFAVSRRFFGCPHTGARRDVKVLPFPAKRVRLHCDDHDSISPDLEKHDELLATSPLGDLLEKLREYLEDNPVPQPIPGWREEVLKVSDPFVESHELPAGIFPVHNTPEDFSEGGEEGEDAGRATEDERTTDTEISEVSETLMEAVGDASPSTVEVPSEGMDVGATQTAVTRFMKNFQNPFVVMSHSTTTSEPMPMPEPAANRNVPTLKYGISELMRFALNWKEDDVVRELFDLGRADAFRWMKLEELRALEDPKYKLPWDIQPIEL